MSRHRSRTDHERASTIDSKSITSYNDWCEDPRAGQPTTHTFPRENHVIVSFQNIHLKGLYSLSCLTYEFC